MVSLRVEHLGQAREHRGHRIHGNNGGRGDTAITTSLGSLGVARVPAEQTCPPASVHSPTALGISHMPSVRVSCYGPGVGWGGVGG